MNPPQRLINGSHLRNGTTPPAPARLEEQGSWVMVRGERAEEGEVENIKKSTGAFKSEALSAPRKTFCYSSCSLTLLRQLDGRWFK